MKTLFTLSAWVAMVFIAMLAIAAGVRYGSTHATMDLAISAFFATSWASIIVAKELKDQLKS